MSALWFPACHGARFNDATLAVRVDGLTIAEVLSLSVDDALKRFAGRVQVAARCRQMTTIHRPAQRIPLKGGTRTRDGGIGVLATRPVVPRELRSFRAGLDGPGPGAVSFRSLRDVMASGDGSGIADIPDVPAVRAGVVTRCALFGRLAEAERVVQISAPAGSGKTVLMRSWVAEADLGRHAAWVPVDSQERDPQGFRISVADALRGTAAGSALVRPLTAAPDLDSWAVVDRLLMDLAPLDDPLWLVIDDAHLLDSRQMLPQLELLLLRAPQRLRFVLATRNDLRLGLHRLRLEGELTEIRAVDLRFSLAEEAERHLEQGVALAREIGRPYLELHGLAHGGHAMLLFRPDVSQAERSRQAIELAERHGWGEEPLAGMAYAQLGIVLLYQGRLAEAEPWLERAERTLRAEVEPAAGMSLRYARAVLELARGRYQEALAAFGRAEKLAATLVGPHTLVTSMRSRMLDALVRAGQTERAEQALAELGEDEPGRRGNAHRRGGAAASRRRPAGGR